MLVGDVAVEQLFYKVGGDLQKGGLRLLVLLQDVVVALDEQHKVLFVDDLEGVGELCLQYLDLLLGEVGDPVQLLDVLLGVVAPPLI